MRFKIPLTKFLSVIRNRKKKTKLYSISKKHFIKLNTIFELLLHETFLSFAASIVNIIILCECRKESIRFVGRFLSVQPCAKCLVTSYLISFPQSCWQHPVDTCSQSIRMTLEPFLSCSEHIKKRVHVTFKVLKKPKLYFK